MPLAPGETPTVEQLLSGIPTIPDKLICERCGERPIDVVVTHLGSADNDRHCYPCFFAVAAELLKGLAENADAG